MSGSLNSIAFLPRVPVGQDGIAGIHPWDVVLLAQAPTAGTSRELFSDQKATVQDLFSVLPIGYGHLTGTKKLVGRYRTGPGPMEELTIGSGLDVDSNGQLFATAALPTMTQKGLLGRYTNSAGIVQEITLGSGLTIDANGVISTTGAGGGGGGGGEAVITLTGPNKLMGRASGGTGGWETLNIGGLLSFNGSTLTASAPSIAASTILGRSSTATTGPAEAITLGTGLTMTGTVLSASAAAISLPTQRLAGRFSTGTGAIEGVQIGSGLTLNATGFLSAAQPNISGPQKIIGRYTAGAGAGEEVGLGTGLSITGGNLTVTVPGGSVPIISGSGKILGRVTGGQGSAEEITLGAGMTLTGYTLSATGSFAFGGASRLLGRGSTGGAGNGQEVTLGTGLVMTGTALSVAFPGQTPPQVSTSNRLLGRYTAGGGDAQEVTIGTGLTMSATGVLSATGGGGGGTSLPTPPAGVLSVLAADASGTVAFIAAESLQSQRIPSFKSIGPFMVQPSIHQGTENLIIAASHIPTFDWSVLGDGYMAEFFNLSTSDITPVIATGATIIWPSGTTGKFQARRPISVRTFSVDTEHFIAFDGGVI